MENRQKPTYHSVAIFVKNIDVSKKFYTEILGTTVALDFGKNVVLKEGISLWEINSSHIIPQQLGIDSISNETNKRFELYFETENIRDIYEAIQTANVKILHAVHEEPWGQQTIRFFDPDGHLIEIGESMPTFVKRLHNSNMTPVQVSQKTSIPLDVVNCILGYGECAGKEKQ